MTPHDSMVAAAIVAGCLFALYLLGKATKFLLKALAFLILLLTAAALVWWFFLGGREEFHQRQLRRPHPATVTMLPQSNGRGDMPEAQSSKFKAQEKLQDPGKIFNSQTPDRSDDWPFVSS